MLCLVRLLVDWFLHLHDVQNKDIDTLSKHTNLLIKTKSFSHIERYHIIITFFGIIR